MAFRAHLDNPGSSFHLQILVLITHEQSLFATEGNMSTGPGVNFWMPLGAIIQPPILVIMVMLSLASRNWAIKCLKGTLAEGQRSLRAGRRVWEGHFI